MINKIHTTNYFYVWNILLFDLFFIGYMNYGWYWLLHKRFKQVSHEIFLFIKQIIKISKWSKADSFQYFLVALYMV